MRVFIGVDKGICTTIIIKKDMRFPSSNIDKRMHEMGTPSQDTSESEGKQPINL